MNETLSYNGREIALVLAPSEESSSFLRGSFLGPAALAAELRDIEPFDPDVGLGLGSRLHFHVEELSEDARELPAALEALERLAGEALSHGRFPLTLGAEHTITLGPLRAALARFGQVGLVQLDAHGDLRDCFEGRLVGHACVMRRALDLGVPVLGLGIRSKCQEEAELVAGTAPVRNLSPREIRRSWDEVGRAIESLPAKVYLTLDMDVFDPTVAPGVGTPEAGGLTWPEVARLIDEVASRREIVAADLVELAPSVERDRTLRVAARALVRVLLRSFGSGSPPRPDGPVARP